MDFYDKIVTDHPLLEYIEDAFANQDIKGVKKYVAKKREQNGVNIGVSQLFNSDLNQMKEFTTYI